MTPSTFKQSAVLGMLLVLVSTAPGRAQTTATLEPGARIRVQTPAGPRVGTLEALWPDSLRLRGEESSTIALDAVRRIDVSHGVQSRTATGLAIGLFAGIAVGGGVGYLTAEDGGLFSRGDVAQATALAGGALGMLIGGFTGAATKKEVWVPVRR